ncbi:MAG TPA: TonB-dependent receptor [Chitinophagales bacterium]|nr:TonB-dependent receptor [Chitinophagales bacterium]
MKVLSRIFVFAFCLTTLLLSTKAFSQTTVTGKVTGDDNAPLAGATVLLKNTTEYAVCDPNGKYTLTFHSPERTATLRFSYLGYEAMERTIDLDQVNVTLNVKLISRIDTIKRTIITGREIRDQAGLQKIDPKKFEYMPSTIGGIEAYLKVLGASSNSELSSQYSVRGGNFDENLVYVNDFEIYRPFLIRSGQQEGLSFVNPDMVGSLLFSTGGFQAKYGDKLSSVLDVTYKRPKKFAGSVGGSMLGGNAHLEGSSKNYRLSYLAGVRYKSNQYLLSSLETKGDYKPSFFDAQALVTYQLSEKTTLEYIANVAFNKYLFEPVDRVTTFGTIKQVLQLNVYFDGQEVDRYNTFMNGLSITTRPRKNLTLKFLASGYYAREDETVDITGDYFIGEVDNNLGNQSFGQVLYSLGVGTSQDWIRNFLDASVVNAGHRGSLLSNSNCHFIQWGATAQWETIHDRLKEWNIIDSAGYNLPYSNTEILMQEYINTINKFDSYRFHGFVQDSWYLNEEKSMSLTYGLRAHYWTLNEQFVVTPRAQFSFTPRRWERDYVFRFAAGRYAQPPFYRELRDLNGVVHRDVKAQQSVHLVAGADHNFTMWNRPFRFVAEAYYKHLWDVNPYELENVRIRYYADNLATGYATGIDLRLNGELVEGAESWISVSVLHTREDIKGDFYFTFDTTYSSPGEIAFIDSAKFYPGFIPRPTDQRVNFALFLQDYIPGNENFKVHLNLVFGTGLPVGPPDLNRYRDTLRIPPYRRVDIGFSALLLNGRKDKYQDRFASNFKAVWFSLEVFNLLGVSNTISYSWLKDNSNTVYAVPNYLTSRRLNAKLQVNF